MVWSLPLRITMRCEPLMKRVNSSVRSSAASAKTAGIEAPFGIAATAGIRNVIVTWTASSEEGLLGYNVYRSTRSDEGFTRLAGIEGTSFSTGQTVYVDSNLVGGQTYFYRVSTITSDGESERSTFVGATVLSDNRAPAAPTLVQAEAVRDDPEKMDLSWNPPTTDVNGAELTGLIAITCIEQTMWQDLIPRWQPLRESGLSGYGVGFGYHLLLSS